MRLAFPVELIDDIIKYFPSPTVLERQVRCQIVHPTWEIDPELPALSHRLDCIGRRRTEVSFLKTPFKLSFSG